MGGYSVRDVVGGYVYKSSSSSGRGTASAFVERDVSRRPDIKFIVTHLSELPLVLLHQRRVDLDLGRRESRGRDELKRRVAEMKC